MARSRAPRREDSGPRSDIERRRMERRAAEGRRSEGRWQEVLGGARRAFASLGYAQSTLEDVANEVGISRAALYYYVGTKEELLVALLTGPIETMRVRIDEIATRDQPASRRLTDALRTYVDAMDELPELFIFLNENLHNVMFGPEAEHIRSNADRYGQTLTALIAEGMENGEFRSDLDAGAVMLGIIGMFNWTHRWYDPSGPHTLEYFGNVFTEMALSSLAPTD